MRTSLLRYLLRPSWVTRAGLSARHLEHGKATHQTKRTDFRGEGRGRTDLTASCPEVDDFDFGGVLCVRERVVRWVGG